MSEFRYPSIREKKLGQRVSLKGVRVSEFPKGASLWVQTRVVGPVVEPLTMREREVVALLCSGVSTNRDLAERLVVANSTVQFHINEVLAKFHVSDRTQIVSYATSHGVVVNGLWEPKEA